MVEQRYESVLSQILELMDTACQASLELLDQYSGGETAGAAQLLSDLRAAIGVVGAAQEPLLPQLEHAYTVEMLDNIHDTLDDIECSIQADNPERAAMKMEFQLFPFLRQLRESFYFWGTIYPEPAKMERYYREEFALHYQNFYVHEGEPARYRLSIVVTGYNHLETTKRCVEQLLKETDFDALNAELILINHGSTDGTLEYFESLNVGKVIHFKHNVRMYMFTTLFQLCRGKYFSFVSNDILVTRDWANILLQCLKSDPKIIAAVPLTPNVANLQMLEVPTNDPDQFTAWANCTNRSNSALWSDRARLMPPLGMYRTREVGKIGFADPYFYSMEFWDDDFSLRARRAGYRQIVCGDVACYHFGSMTGRAAQHKENTLTYGRKLFRAKHGVDAWGSGFCYDYPAIQLLKKALPARDEISLLALDCGMGDAPLQIRNELRRQDRNCEIYQITCQKEYFPDLQYTSKEIRVASDLTEALSKTFSPKQFSCVYLGRDIEEYEAWEQLLKKAAQRITPGGCFLFSCKNPFYVQNINAMLRFSLPENLARYTVVNAEQVKLTAEQNFTQVQKVSLEQPVNGLEAFISHYYGANEQAVQKLKIQRYYFVCRR